MNTSEELKLVYEEIEQEKRELDRLFSLKSELLDDRRSAFDDLHIIKNRISSLCADIERVKSDISWLYYQKESYIYELRSKRSELDSAYSNCEDSSTIYWLKSARNTIGDHIDEINQKINDLKDEKRDLVDELIDAKGERDTIGCNLAEMKERINAIVESINLHKERKRILFEKVAELKR